MSALEVEVILMEVEKNISAATGHRLVMRDYGDGFDTFDGDDFFSADFGE